MRDAVVFNPNNQLEFQEVRMNVTRIPEVLARVRDAEAAWTAAVGESAGDLASFLVSEDERFAAGPRRKLVAVGVVQIGLFDRYQRAFGTPEFLVGFEHGPVAVALGRRTLASFVAETAAANRITKPTPTWWTRDEGGWSKLGRPPAAAERVVTIGPGGAVEGEVDSVDLDPALAWFWTSLSGNGLAIAN